MKIKTYSLNEDIVLYPLALYSKKLELLVIADMHIGIEKALEQIGIHLPKSSYSEMKQLVEEYIKIIKPKKIAFAGDIKHDFGKLNIQEFHELKDFVKFIADLNIEVFMALGNHDNYLTPFLERAGIIHSKEYLEIGNILITHGHYYTDEFIQNDRIDTIIIGHEHPSIAIRDEVGGSNKFKVTISGKIGSKNIIVLPAFSPLRPGTDVNSIQQKDFLSPVLKKADFDSLKVYVHEEGDWFNFPLNKI